MAVSAASGAVKCAHVTGELNFETCLDHRDGDFPQALAAACPHGIDISWENLGGALQRAMFPHLNDFDRMVMCGMSAEDNDPVPQSGLNLMSAVLKRLRIQGLIVSDSWQRLPGWQAMAIPHIGSGAPRDRENIVQGIENAPAAWSGSAPKLWHVSAKVSR